MEFGKDKTKGMERMCIDIRWVWVMYGIDVGMGYEGSYFTTLNIQPHA